MAIDEARPRGLSAEQIKLRDDLVGRLFNAFLGTADLYGVYIVRKLTAVAATVGGLMWYSALFLVAVGLSLLRIAALRLRAVPHARGRVT